MRSCKLLLIISIVAIACLFSCSKATTEQAQKDLDRVIGIYDGYYEVLTKNMPNPTAGLKASQEYINVHKKELSDLAKSINKNPKANQLIEKFQADLKDKSYKKGKELGKSYAKYIKDISQQMDQMTKALSGE